MWTDMDEWMDEGGGYLPTVECWVPTVTQERNVGVGKIIILKLSK